MNIVCAFPQRAEPHGQQVTLPRVPALLLCHHFAGAPAVWVLPFLQIYVKLRA